MPGPLPSLVLELLFLAALFLSGCKTSTPDTEADRASAAPIDTTLTTIFQDSQGRHWFGGGHQGVYRFDGQEWHHFPLERQLRGKAVIGMQEDLQGRIYLESDQTVLQYDGKTFRDLPVLDSHRAVLPYSEKTTGDLPALDSDGTRHLWAGGLDDLWFSMGTDHSGPFRFDGESLLPMEFPWTHRADTFHTKFPQSSYSPFGIYRIYRDRRGHLWFGTASVGLGRFDGKEFAWMFEQELTSTPEGGDFGIRSVVEDLEGNYWICTPNFRFQFEATTVMEQGTRSLTYTRQPGVPLSESIYLLDMTADSLGNVWGVAHQDGVYRISGTEMVHFDLEDADHPTVRPFTIYTDREGTLWVGTFNAGAFWFDGQEWRKFSPHPPVSYPQ